VEPVGLLSMRHLQLAVRIARQWRLVDESVLAAAGFRVVPSRVVPPFGGVAAESDLLDGAA
ncbi:MAG TPA: hypothetical protein VFN75_10590, partial [Pseudonocardiaceae bacterium]|nr:hypothetical protein [Pseudonocardiaceae bacterium]